MNNAPTQFLLFDEAIRQRFGEFASLELHPVDENFLTVTDYGPLVTAATTEYCFVCHDNPELTLTISLTSKSATCVFVVVVLYKVGKGAINLETWYSLSPTKLTPLNFRFENVLTAAEFREHYETFLEQLIDVLETTFAKTLQGENFEPTPIDWQGYM